MRHRITSFRAVEPKSQPCGAARPDKSRLLRPCLQCDSFGCEQQVLHEIILPSQSFARSRAMGDLAPIPGQLFAAILRYPRNFWPGWQVERRQSVDFHGKAATAESHGIQQPVIRGQCHHQLRGPVLCGLCGEWAGFAGGGNRHRQSALRRPVADQADSAARAIATHRKKDGASRTEPRGPVVITPIPRRLRGVTPILESRLSRRRRWRRRRP